MGLADRGVDTLAIFLTGGVANTNPDLSLGGAQSARRVRGFGAIVSSIIPAIRIDDVFPASNPGQGTISSDVSGNISYTPPQSTQGAGVAVAPGTSAIISGQDPNMAVRVFVEAGLPLPPLSFETLLQIEVLNGAIAQDNVADAQRAAGWTTYRGLILASGGLVPAVGVRLWFQPVAGAQAVWSLALETPAAGAIQTIPNQTTAPAGRSWVTPTTEAGALVVPVASASNPVGLWVRRVFPPSGAMNVREDVKLAVKYFGA